MYQKGFVMTASTRAPGSVSGDVSARDVFARLQRAVIALDMEVQADFYAIDGVLEWPFAPAGMPRRVAGRDAIRRLLVPIGERAQAAGIRRDHYRNLRIHDTADPEVIVIEFDLEGEVVASGERYCLSYIQVLQTRCGEIVSFRDYWNPEALAPLLHSAVPNNATAA